MPEATMIEPDASSASRTLQIGGRTITFDLPIASVLEVGDLTVVLLSFGGKGPLAARNVLAFERDGLLRWRIQPSPYGGVPDQFIGIRIEDGRLTAGVGTGYQFKVNLEDGSLEEIVRFTK